MRTGRQDNENGGAVLEFAIITGVLALLVFWSHFFFDIIQVRMKTLEAARTALFEFTAYPLSDFDQGSQTSHDRRYKDAADVVEHDIQHLYGTDLDSAYRFKKTKIETKRLSLDSLTVGSVKLANGTPYSMQFLNLLNMILQMPAYKSFNKKGFVSAEVKSDITSSFVPTDFKFGKSFRVRPLTKHMKQKFYMLVDPWKLEDGCNVIPSGDYDTTNGPLGTCNNASGGGESLLHKQVGRVSYLGFTAPALGGAGNILGAGAMNPFAVRTASINFYEDSTSGRDGRSQLSVDGGEDKFYTAPYCDEGGVGGAGPCSGPYLDAFKSRGDHFMGCPKEQYDGKWDCEYGKINP
jgi:hypothetical protein